MGDISQLNSLAMAWHGVAGDARIWRAKLTPPGADARATAWSRNEVVGQSTAGPGLDGGGHVLVWKDAATASMHLSAEVGGTAAPDPRFAATSLPAVAMFGNQLLLAWRRPDAVVAWADLAGGAWSRENTVGRTSHGPAVAVAGNVLALVWKGPDGDAQISGTALRAGAWSSPGPLRPQAGAMLTSDAPAIHGSPVAGFTLAWKGVPGDDRIWWAQSSDGMDWTTPQPAVPQAGAILTSSGPAIARWRHGLALAWKGVEGDQRLWWSTLDTGADRWATPQPVDASDNSDAGPTLGSYAVGFL